MSTTLTDVSLDKSFKVFEGVLRSKTQISIWRVSKNDK